MRKRPLADNVCMQQIFLDRIHRCETQLRDFLRESLRGIPLDALARPVIAGKWSALENLAHLGRYHEVFLQRLEQVLGVNSPVLSRYRAEDDAEWPAWRLLPPGEVIGRLEILRIELVTKLKSLEESDFSKTATHPKFGEMPLSLWLEFFLVHEGHHLYAVLQQVRSK